MVHILLLHILCLRSGIGMPVFMPDPWSIVVIIVLKSCTWLNTGAAVGEKRFFVVVFFGECLQYKMGPTK